MRRGGPDDRFMRYVQNPLWNSLCDHHSRLEIDGRYRPLESRRILHGTAHDVLMAAPTAT